MAAGQPVASEPESDRRVRRTRRLLREALLALILEKGYDRVTVQDVLERADVGRATFYAHFRDKDDLLLSGAADLRESLRQQMAAFAAGQVSGARDTTQITRVLFEHAGRHRRLYRALVGRRGSGTLLKYAHDDLAALIREHLEDAIARRRLQPEVPLEVTVEFLASALLALLTWWLDNDMPYTADEMGRMFQRLAGSGVPPALGTSM
jgi:AcrR family transcriptional regulator